MNSSAFMNCTDAGWSHFAVVNFRCLCVLLAFPI